MFVSCFDPKGDRRMLLFWIAVAGAIVVLYVWVRIDPTRWR
jgi:hypothetical protein